MAWPEQFDRVAEMLADLARQGNQTAITELVRALPGASNSGVRGSTKLDRLEKAIADLGEVALQPLIEALEGAVAQYRAATTRRETPAFMIGRVSSVLGRIGDRRAVGPLLEALEAWSDMGDAIAPALAVLGDRAALGPLRDLAETGNLGPSRAALVALGRLGGADQIPYLLKWVDDANPQFLDAAFKGLAVVGEPAIETLLALLSEGGRPPLAYRGDPEARTIQPWRRRLAAWALGEMRSERAIEALSGLAQDESEEQSLRAAAIRERWHASGASGRCRYSSAWSRRPVVRKGPYSSGRRRRWGSGSSGESPRHPGTPSGHQGNGISWDSGDQTGTGRIQAGGTVPPQEGALLRDLLEPCRGREDGPTGAGRRGRQGRRWLGEAGAAGPLDPREQKREAWMLAAASVKGDRRAVGDGVSAACGGQPIGSRSVLAEREELGLSASWHPDIEKLKKERDLPSLVRALFDDEASDRAAAAKALGELGDERAVEPLIQALRAALPREAVSLDDWLADMDMRGRPASRDLESAAIKQALRRLIPNERVDEIEAEVRRDLALEKAIRGLTNKGAQARYDAVRSLERLGDARAVAPLIDALQDTNATVRQKAEEALKRIGGPDADRALAEYRAREK